MEAISDHGEESECLEIKPGRAVETSKESCKMPGHTYLTLF